MNDQMIHVSNCPSCGHYPTQFCDGYVIHLSSKANCSQRSAHDRIASLEKQLEDALRSLGKSALDARAQDGQGAEPAAWMCITPEGKPWGAVTEKFNRDIWMRRSEDGRTVRPLIYGDAQPKSAGNCSPKWCAIHKRGSDALEKKHERCVEHGYDGIDHALDTLFAVKLGPQATALRPEGNEWMLTETHTGMRISAEGVLGRVRGQLKFGAQEMLKHLEAMAESFYSGNVKAVDQFLQTWDLDDKRPQPPAQEGSDGSDHH